MKKKTKQINKDFGEIVKGIRDREKLFLYTNEGIKNPKLRSVLDKIRYMHEAAHHSLNHKPRGGYVDGSDVQREIDAWKVTLGSLKPSIKNKRLESYILRAIKGYNDAAKNNFGEGSIGISGLPEDKIKTSLGFQSGKHGFVKDFGTIASGGFSPTFGGGVSKKIKFFVDKMEKQLCGDMKEEKRS